MRALQHQDAVTLLRYSVIERAVWMVPALKGGYRRGRSEEVSPRETTTLAVRAFALLGGYGDPAMGRCQDVLRW